MKIIQFNAENVKRLRAVEIKPSGELVEIAGKNGQGKTSILDSIWWALAGAANIQGQPIRKGEAKARIRLDLGEIIVERRFSTTSEGSSLRVESADGVIFKSPQAMLDALIGALSFDPIAFANSKPKDQFETLKGVVSLDVDLERLEGLNRGDYDKRTEANRRARTAQAAADAITLPSLPAIIPSAPVDLSEIMAKITDAARVNGEIAARKARRQDAELKLSEMRVAVKELEEKLKNADPLPDPVDIDALRQEHATGEAANRLFETSKRKRERLEEARLHEAEAKEIGERIEARETAKREAIKAAKMPVEGLGFGAGFVTFNGLPFEQASTAEQVRVSLAIAMAMNPKLRVIRIKQGNDLDEDNLRLVAEMAKANDYQIWIERVEAKTPIAVVIEDGAVKP